MEYANGNVYEGDWKKGVRDGTGTMTYADGSKYTGDWKANKKSGFGTLKKTEYINMQTPLTPQPTRLIKKINSITIKINKIQE